jgi:hypothetical protein
LGYAELGLAVSSLKALVRNLDADNAKYAADDMGSGNPLGIGQDLNKLPPEGVSKTDAPEFTTTISQVNQKNIHDQGPWDPDTGQTVTAGNQKTIEAIYAPDSPTVRRNGGSMEAELTEPTSAGRGWDVQPSNSGTMQVGTDVPCTKAKSKGMAGTVDGYREVKACSIVQCRVGQCRAVVCFEKSIFERLARYRCI